MRAYLLALVLVAAVAGLAACTQPGACAMSGDESSALVTAGGSSGAGRSSGVERRSTAPAEVPTAEPRSHSTSPSADSGGDVEGLFLMPLLFPSPALDTFSPDCRFNDDPYANCL